MSRQQTRMRPAAVDAAVPHLLPSSRAFAARSRFGTPTSWSSNSGPLDVLVPIPSSPDLSYSQSSSPLPASSSPLRPPSLRMHTPDLPPSSPIALSPRSFWHVALNDGPGVPHRKPNFRQYSHATPSLSPTDSSFSRDDGRDFFPSMKAHRRSSSESAPTLVSDVDPSEFSDDVDMIDIYSRRQSEDPFADAHTVSIVQTGYSDPIEARISDTSTQIYASHHRYSEETKHATYLSTDYEIAAALLDLRRQVRISSNTSSFPRDNVSTTFPSTSAEFPGSPIRRQPTTQSYTVDMSLSSMKEEGLGEAAEMNPCSEKTVKEENIPLSPVPVVRNVEVLRVAHTVVGDDVEIPMPAPKVSFPGTDTRLDSRELAISELFSSVCPGVSSKPGSESPDESSDRCMPIELAGDSLLDAALASAIEVDGADHTTTLDSAPSPHVECLEVVDIDTSTHELPQSATSIENDNGVAGSTSASLEMQSQDRAEVTSEVPVSDPVDSSVSESTSPNVPIHLDIPIPDQRTSPAIEDQNTSPVDPPGRKGKERFKDDENAERQQPKKRRRRPAATILSESLVMNSRSTSPALSDTSSLSPLSEDEVVVRDCQPAKKRRRKQGDSKRNPAGAKPDASNGEGDVATRDAANTVEPTPFIDNSSSESADASVQAEMRGFLIQAMGLSRASSMPASSLLREVLREQPQLAHQRTKNEWLSLIEDTLANAPGCDVFGRIDRIGTDAADNPLEAQWFYIPEKDEDQERATLLSEMMPKKRQATKSHKQYYYRPLGKMSRWDAEEDA